MKILTVVGARPQFVKASAVSRAFTRAGGFTEVLVHTGQHHHDEMSAVFFRELGIAQPDVNLCVSGGSHGQMTGRMLEQVEAVMVERRPDVVLVYGDTNSTLAGALAAAKLGLPIVHVEAGLRSFQPLMPEEINRVVTDHVSTLLCCPTRTAVRNLKQEGFSRILAGGELASGSDLARSTGGPWVANVGDVMLDVLLERQSVAAATSTVLQRLALNAKGYAVLTVHRAENATSGESLRQLLRSIVELSRILPVMFAIHPRTRALLTSSGDYEELALQDAIRMVEPLSYLDFLHLQANARVILTDSGGVQKEAFFLGVPCLTLRNETEWPETLEAGGNRLVGGSGADLIAAVEKAATSAKPAHEAFGKGDAASRIVTLVRAAFLS